MKTSKQIIIIIIGILLATLVASLLLMRSELQAVIDRGDIFKYQVTGVQEFDKVEFSSNWQVKLRQDRAYKVEFIPEDSVFSLLVVNQNGTLIFLRDSTLVDHDRVIKVKVTVPFLRQIDVGDGTTLDMQMMKLDTLDLNFGDNTTFIGIENQILDATIKTTGKTTFLLTDDPDV